MGLLFDTDTTADTQEFRDKWYLVGRFDFDTQFSCRKVSVWISHNGYAYPSWRRDMTRDFLSVWSYVSGWGRPFCTLEHISSVYTGLSLQWQYGLFCQPWLPSECIEEDKFLNNNNNCQIFELLYQAASICKTSHVIEYVASVLICNSGLVLRCSPNHIYGCVPTDQDSQSFLVE